MKYKIEYLYTTGDSNYTYEHYNKIELSWDTIEQASENLERIKNHYLYVCSWNFENWKIIEKFLKKPIHRNDAENIQREAMRKDWFCVPNFCINLYSSLGRKFMFHPPWIGYFEALHEIEVVKDSILFRKINNKNIKTSYKFV